MTTGGWLFLIVAWGVIISLVVYCYARTLSCEEPEHDEE